MQRACSWVSSRVSAASRLGASCECYGRVTKLAGVTAMSQSQLSVAAASQSRVLRPCARGVRSSHTCSVLCHYRKKAAETHGKGKCLKPRRQCKTHGKGNVSTRQRHVFHQHTAKATSVLSTDGDKCLADLDGGQPLDLLRVGVLRLEQLRDHRIQRGLPRGRRDEMQVECAGLRHLCGAAIKEMPRRWIRYGCTISLAPHCACMPSLWLHNL